MLKIYVYDMGCNLQTWRLEPVVDVGYNFVCCAMVEKIIDEKTEIPNRTYSASKQPSVGEIGWIAYRNMLVKITEICDLQNLFSDAITEHWQEIANECNTPPSVLA